VFARGQKVNNTLMRNKSLWSDSLHVASMGVSLKGGSGRLGRQNHYRLDGKDSTIKSPKKIDRQSAAV
jgi:hypothetical protein